jgi:hypothetical protein
VRLVTTLIRRHGIAVSQALNGSRQYGFIDDQQDGTLS